MSILLLTVSHNDCITLLALTRPIGSNTLAMSERITYLDKRSETGSKQSFNLKTSANGCQKTSALAVRLYLGDVVDVVHS